MTMTNLSEPKVFGDQDITITIGPTGLTKVWAGQTQLSMLNTLELFVRMGIPVLELSFQDFSPAEEEYLRNNGPNIEEFKAKLSNFPQVEVVAKKNTNLHKIKRLADTACDLLRASENRQGSAERKLEEALAELDPLWSTR